MRDRFLDAERLIQHGLALRELAAEPEPTAHQVAGTRLVPGARLGLLAGSFNPPTIAHQTLALAGLADGQLDAVWYALSIRIVDKEVVTGAGLEDRLLMLDALSEDDQRLGTVVVNRGLYVDQARIVRTLLPDLRALVFLVGHDKIVQIFDPRYYADRDAALEALFELATFLVAPRGDDDHGSLAALLGQPENRRFAGAVRPLALPPTLRAIASSTIRGDLAAGGRLNASVPDVVAEFVEETGAYVDEARYGRRRAIVDEAVDAAARNPPADPASLRARLGPI